MSIHINHLTRFLFVMFISTLVACGGEADITPPSAAIQFPTAVSLTDGDTIIVRGTASDASEISSVSVNGVTASSDDGFATWQVSVPLNLGENTLTVETTDTASNSDSNAASVAIERQPNTLREPSSIAIDRSNNRALVLETAPSAVLAVDLTTGIRSILSDSTTPNANNTLIVPASITVDSANNRALVVDFVSNAVIAVDLTTGVRTILSDNDTPNATNAFLAPLSITLDSGNNRALVLDIGSGVNTAAVLAVDLSTGARTVISNNSTPNAVNALLNPQEITLDSANNRALVVDSDLDALVAVDLSTGARTIVSNNTLPNAANAFIAPFRMALDSTNNRALVLDSELDAVLAVDLTTGARTIFLDSSTLNISLNGRPVAQTSITIDAENGRALVLDEGLDAVAAVDLSTGVRTVLSDSSTPNATNAFSSPLDILLDTENNRVLVQDANLDAALVALDLNTGARTITQDNISFPFATQILDSANNRALVLNTRLGAVEVIDTITQERTILSDSTTPNTLNALVAPTAFVLDSANNRVLVVDIGLSALLAVDLSTGERTIISDQLTPNANNFLLTPIRIAVDSENNRALVTDAALPGVLAVDLITGERVIFSR